MTRRGTALSLLLLLLPAAGLAQDLAGVWIDGEGRELRVEGTRDRWRVAAGANLAFQGQLEGDHFRAELRYADYASTPPVADTALRRALVGNRAVLYLDAVSDSGFYATLLPAADEVRVRGVVQRVRGISGQFTRKPIINEVLSLGMAPALPGVPATILPSAAEQIVPAGPWTELLMVTGWFLRDHPQVTARVEDPDGALRYTRILGGRLGDPRLEGDAVAILRAAGGDSTGWRNGPVGRQVVAIWDSSWSRTRAGRFVGPPAPGREPMAFLLRVEVPRDATQGIKRLRFRGAEGDWTLDRGGGEATVRFIREAVTATDSLESVYLGDRIMVEVSTSVPLSQEGLGIILGEGGARHPDLPGATLSAPRVAPGRYRTAPIHLVPRGTDLPAPPASASVSGPLDLTTRPGATLQATLVNDGAVTRTQATAVRVLATPSSPVQLWRDALRRAAELNHVTRAWDTLSEAGWRDVGRLPGPAVGSVQLSIGEHAAMLVLRRAFIDATRVYEEALPQLTDEAGVRGYGRLLLPYMRDQAHPLARVRVPYIVDFAQMTADSAPLARFYDRAFVRDSLDRRVYAAMSSLNDPDELDEFILSRAILMAQRRHLEHTRRSRLIVDSIPENDAEKLLRLTGFGFSTIVASVIPQLVRVEQVGGVTRIVPDMEARQQVRGVATGGEMLRLSERAHEEAVDGFLALASAVGAALSLPLGGILAPAVRTVVAQIIMAGVSTASAANLAANKVPRWIRERDELRFAEGTDGVLGPDRLDVARMSLTPWWAMALDVGLTVGFGGLDLAAACRATSMAVARASAQRLLRQIETGGLDAFRQLPRDEQVKFLMALMEARAANALPNAALTEAQRDLLRGLGRLESDVRAAAKAAGRRYLDPELSQALSRQAGTPIGVEVDFALEAGTVRVMNELAEGAVPGVRMIVGEGTAAAALAGHLETAADMARASGLLGEARAAARRAAAWMSGRDLPPPPGSNAWNAEYELRKLPGLLEEKARELQAAGTAADRARILREMESLEAQAGVHRRMLEEMDRTPGVGYIAGNGPNDAVESVANALSRDRLLSSALDTRASTYGVGTTRLYRRALARKLLQENPALAQDLGPQGRALFEEMMQVRMNGLETAQGNPAELLNAAMQEAAADARAAVQRGGDLSREAEFWRSYSELGDQVEATYRGGMTYRELARYFNGERQPLAEATSLTGIRRLTDQVSQYASPETRQAMARYQQELAQVQADLAAARSLRAQAPNGQSLEQLRTLANRLANRVNRVAEGMGFAAADDVFRTTFSGSARSIRRLYPAAGAGLPASAISGQAAGARILDVVYEVVEGDGSKALYVVEAKGSVSTPLEELRDFSTIPDRASFRVSGRQQGTPEYIAEVMADMNRSASGRVPQDVLNAMNDLAGSGRVRSFVSMTGFDQQTGRYLTNLFEVR